MTKKHGGTSIYTIPRTSKNRPLICSRVRIYVDHVGPRKTRKVVQQTTSPVTRLPVEILCLIFPYHRRPSPPSKDLTWLFILRVCRQWRAAATIGCPHLWTNIYIRKSRSLGAFMLRHAKVLPIALKDLRVLCGESRETRMLLEKHLHRVRELGFVSVEQAMPSSQSGLK